MEKMAARCERSVLQWHSIQLAQGLGGEFIKEEAVVSREASELPNTELRSDLGDRCLGRISGFERFPNLVERSAVEISHRR